ncbi:hypothetical protein N7505_005951 [Penicillium chrysogenum]|uniref:Uncharacterized protein n=1 Tax=Penicillium chrysogenum TaxID=5076 RepID=A0ABQ8WJS1_PENCH|nr:hypothetical protein N7505_005951 [Penicillium chrysogenum]
MIEGASTIGNQDRHTGHLAQAATRNQMRILISVNIDSINDSRALDINFWKQWYPELPGVQPGSVKVEAVYTRSPTTEASIRWIVDALILNAYGIAGSKIPYTQPPGPDYGIWYGVHEAICLNVLIMEANKTDIDSGIARALGYMTQRTAKTHGSNLPTGQSSPTKTST